MSVYFIACAGFIKVGFSDDPEKRCANLFRGSSRYTAPRAVYEARGSQELIGTIEGCKSTERRLHRALDDYYSGCEWFIDEPELRTYLLSLNPDDEDADFPPLRREAGPIWETLPSSEFGGRNVELALSVYDKRKQAAS